MREGWEIKKLGEVIAEYSVRNKSGADLPVYSVTNSQGFCKDYFNKEVASKERSTYKIVPKGCFAYNPSRINVGSVDWQRYEDKVIVSPLYVVFEVSEKLRQDYLLYYLKSDSILLMIKTLATGTVRANLKFDILSNFSISIPPLPLQEKIVSELDLLSGVIEKKRQQLKELDNLAQSIFYDMFGDPITNEMGWEVKKLGEVAPAKEYKGEVPNIDGKYWLLNLDMIIAHSGEIIEQCYFEPSEIGNSTIVFNTDNVLYSKLRPYLNKVVVPNGIGFATSELVPLFPNKDCLERVYLSQALRSPSFVEYISAKVAGAKMPRVSMNEFREFLIPLPPLPLQQSFAAKVEAIEQQKALIKQSLAETETLFNSRMEYYFGEGE